MNSLEQSAALNRRSPASGCYAFTEEWLDRPQTVANLAARAGKSERAVRRWLDSLGSRVSVGYTRPRTYWLHEQEQIRDIAEHRSETQTISSRNRMDSNYAYKA